MYYFELDAYDLFFLPKEVKMICDMEIRMAWTWTDVAEKERGRPSIACVMIHLCIDIR